MTIQYRAVLLGTAASVALFAFSTPAAAQCDVAPAAAPVTGTITCSTTSTVDDTYDNDPAATERNYDVDTTTGPVTLIIASGATVSTSGLSLSHAAGENAINVANNGTVSASTAVNAGGVSALEVTAGNDANVNYSGEGNVYNTDAASTGHGLDFYMQGTGDLNAIIGIDGGQTTTISTLAPGAAAVQVNRLEGTGGAVTVTTTSDTTLMGKVAGINVDTTATGNVTIINAATIKSSGAPGSLFTGINVKSDLFGENSISITNSGAVGSSTDRLSISGINAEINNNFSTGTIGIVNSGAITAGVSGITVYNLGAGATSIENRAGAIDALSYGIYARTNEASLNITTGTGAITASAADTGIGIAAMASTGAMTITTGTGAVTGGGYGILADSAGAQTFNINGAVTGTAESGIYSSTDGHRIINVAAGGNVRGGSEAIFLTGTGTAAISNLGTIGDTSSGVAIDASAAGQTAVVIGNPGTNAGTLNGRLLFGGGNDLIGLYGTWNTQGTTGFGAGTDSISTTSGSAINLAAATTFTGLESMAVSGRLNMGSTTLTSTGTNFNIGTTGILDTNGSASLLGISTFSNSGTVDLAAGTFTIAPIAINNSGTFIADEGAATITGQTRFNNSATGRIDLQDGAANDTLTINSAYVGSAGARLQIDATETASDRLVITGAISGTTAIDANILGTGALVSGGLQVVDGQSTSTADAFVLGTVTGGSSLVSYSVTQNGSDYYLNGTLSEAGFEPMLVGSFVPDLWYASADEVAANLAAAPATEGASFWMQAYAGRNQYGDKRSEQTVGGVDYTLDQKLSVNRFGFQGGVDVGIGEAGRIGLTGGLSRHEAKGSSKLEAKGWNVGAYAAFGGPTGFHGDALLKHDRYDVEFKGGALDEEGSKVRSTGIDGSIGYRIPMGGEGSSLDLTTGLSQVWSKANAFEADGLRYTYRDIDSTRGRAGARWTMGGAIQPYVSATMFHEFGDGGRVALYDGEDNFDLDIRRRATWGRLEGGLGGSPNGFPTLAAWADIGDVKGIGARLGMRFGGSAPAPAPAPVVAPPAPVEPAPATQTCYDGSVILATDICPTPPAPPAPVVTPERG